jgi:N-acetylneuraminic acid mutarotase
LKRVFIITVGLFFICILRLHGQITVTVPGTAGPWSPTLNPGLDYGIHDNTNPVVIDGSVIAFASGAVLTITYVSGLVGNQGEALYDANGGPTNLPRNTYQGVNGRFPAFYMSPSIPVYQTELVGAFASNGVVVGTPFAVGDGPTALTIPVGANQLLLGVDDDRFVDNVGSFTITIQTTAPQGSWQTVTALPTARAQMAVATGPDGRIYVIGGVTQTSPPYNPVNTVEVYDPSANAWSAVAPMPVARYNLAAATANGLIYAVGGYNNGDLSNVEAFNPITNTWTELAPMPTARMNLALAVGRDGRIYAIGGDTAAGGHDVGTVEAYDPTSNTWSTGFPSMPTPRQDFAGLRGSNGLIYAIAGLTNNGSPVYQDTAEVYDSSAQSWSTLAPLPTALQNPGAATGFDGTIYVMGGANASTIYDFNYAYNVASNTWSSIAPLPIPTANGGAAIGGDGRVYLIGGYTPAGSSWVISNSVEAFTPPQPYPGPLQFIAVKPCRVVDTRNATGPFGGPELAANSTRAFAIRSSSCNIPSTALAYSVNATVVPNGTLGYLTLWPYAWTQPLVSTLNSDGRVKANAAIVPAGTDFGGSVNVYVTDATQFVLDIDGYLVQRGSNASGLQFYSLSPCRVADTRNANGPLGGPYVKAGTTRSFPVDTTCGIPTSATAYSLNITALPHGPLTYITAWPQGQSMPLASVLNALTGTVVANAALIPAGSPNGGVSVYASNDTDLVIDADGYFAPPDTGGLSFYAASPCRVLDTRTGSGAFSGSIIVNVEGSTCNVAASAQAYVLNSTVVPPSALSYLTLWPDGEPQPYVSTLNALDGAITSNMAVVPAQKGKVDAFANNPTNLIVDIAGYFAP